MPGTALQEDGGFQGGSSLRVGEGPLSPHQGQQEALQAREHDRSFTPVLASRWRDGRVEQPASPPAPLFD